MSKKSTASSGGGGIGIGAVIAVVWSWTTNHSVLLCIVHGMFGWLYVFYRLGGCGGNP